MTRHSVQQITVKQSLANIVRNGAKAECSLVQRQVSAVLAADPEQIEAYNAWHEHRKVNHEM